MRRFLSVWLPRWSIERYLQKNTDHNKPMHRKPVYRSLSRQTTNTLVSQAAENQRRPFALITEGARGPRIAAIDHRAEEDGITINLSLADARALSPQLVTEKATPEADAIALERLTFWGLRYSPMVTTHGPDGFALDITGCDHLFGGERAMLETLAEKMRNFQLTARLSIADTIGAAWAAARFGKNAITLVEERKSRAFLAPLPLKALRLDDAMTQRLNQLGLRHIGALLDAPKAPLTARFGPHLIRRLDQAIGTVPEIFSPLTPPPNYHLRYPFIEPIVQLSAVEAVLVILSERMMLLLKQAQKGARQLELRLFRVDGHMERVSVGTSRLCDEAEHMTLLFREKLSRLRDDLDMGYGFDLVTLSAFHVEDVANIQTAWAGPEDKTANSQNLAQSSAQNLDQLLDRFGNRFGFDKVTRLIPAESHLPERAFRRVAASDEMKNVLWEKSTQQRPFLLFTPPEPVQVLAEVPDGPPLRFKWRRQHHHIIAAEGPERLSPEWWRAPSQDTSPQTRDYYRVEDNTGHRFWLFRDGLYDREDDHPRWYLHGVFP